MHTLFISDLHLSPKHPDITASFIQFMREEAIKADALYVLGDLFDFWIGDDDPTPLPSRLNPSFANWLNKVCHAISLKEIAIFWLGNGLLNKQECSCYRMKPLSTYMAKASYCMEIHSAPKIHATLHFEPKYISLGYSDYLDFFLLHLSKSLSAKYSQTYEMTNNISPWWSWMLHPAKSSRLCIDIT